MKKVHLGDKGETSLIGKRVSKVDLRVKVYGSLDELSSFIGLCRTEAKDFRDIDSVLEKVQEKIFAISTNLATTVGESKMQITIDDANGLEKQTLKFEKELPELKKFIFPTGGRLASLLHVSRSVCRRTERDVVELMQKKKIDGATLVYLNRLSDLLFIMARLANKRENISDKEWIS